MKPGPKAGLLPLYLQLYDDTSPELRREFNPLLATVTDNLADAGIEVIRVEPCRVESEFRDAVRQFQNEDVDLIITLHLAYSPSLESVEALASASRPILMLDTTMDFNFGQDVDPARIMYDHGIHGVQDLACMLRRRGVPFEIVAGHVTQSNVLQRAADVARAAHAASALRKTRALRVGETFKGMGDFAVPEKILQEVLGISVDEVTTDRLASAVGAVSSAAIEDEMRLDRKRFSVDIPEEVHRRSVRAGLALRRVLEEGDYTAFSVNFLSFDSSEGSIDTVPFLEISKAMSRGLGYAGEGDVLTASLVAALNRAFGKTTFTEIFCPDWEHGAVFISHMGEVNPNVAAEKPRLCEKDFPWTGAHNPAVVTCAPAPGPATLVNLAPGPEDTFRIISAPVEVLEDTKRPGFQDSVRGWIRPACTLETFLERYSRAGGTHHSALVLGDHTEAITAFASFASIELVTIQS